VPPVLTALPDVGEAVDPDGEIPCWTSFALWGSSRSARSSPWSVEGWRSCDLLRPAGGRGGPGLDRLPRVRPVEAGEVL